MGDAELKDEMGVKVRETTNMWMSCIRRHWIGERGSEGGGRFAMDTLSSGSGRVAPSHIIHVTDKLGREEGADIYRLLWRSEVLVLIRRLIWSSSSRPLDLEEMVCCSALPCILHVMGKPKAASRKQPRVARACQMYTKVEPIPQGAKNLTN